MVSCIEHVQSTPRYGITRVAGVAVAMHRVAYCFARQIPLAYIKGSVVRHTCDNERCINPRHLILGTISDNMADRQNRNRQARGVTAGNAVLTPESVQFIRNTYVKGSRQHGAAAIARLLGVGHNTVLSVISGRTWSHL